MYDNGAGITFTINTDRSITVNGTNTSSQVKNIVLRPFNDVSSYPVGNYKVNCKNANNDVYMVLNNTNLKNGGDYNFTISSVGQVVSSFVIQVAANATIDNVTLYPMMRLATDLDPTYQPYCKTNQQLTEDTNAMLNELGAKNVLEYTLDSLKALNTVGTWSGNVYTRDTLTFTVNSDLSITVNGSTALPLLLCILCPCLSVIKSFTSTFLYGLFPIINVDITSNE